MKVLILCLLIVAPAFGQSDGKQEKPKWKLIKELSGTIRDDLTFETYGAEIARNGEIVKLLLDVRFPSGMPHDICADGSCKLPDGVDAESVRGVSSRVKLNCAKLTVSAEKESADLYTIGQRHFKTREPLVQLKNGHIFAEYFCEQPSGPRTNTPPKLKPIN